MLFIDSLHTYQQCAGELRRHGAGVRKFLVFHDTMTFGSVGAFGETGKPDPHVIGIRPAIDHWMSHFHDWVIKDHWTNSHGLLVLERVPR